MKKFSAIIMSFVMAFTFAACEKENSSVSTSENASTSAVDTSVTHKENTTEKVTAITTEKDTEKATSSTSAKPAVKTTAAPETTSKSTQPQSVSESKAVTTAAVTEKPTKSDPQVSVVTDSDIEKIKAGFLNLVNKERAKKGAQPLSDNSALNAAADIRSRELLKKFSHTRPDGQPFYTVLNQKQYTVHGTGENIQYTSHLTGDFTDASDLFTGRDDQIVSAYTLIFNNFKNSPDHYSNIINKNFCDTGIGISYSIHKESGLAIFYICQLFGSGNE